MVKGEILDTTRSSAASNIATFLPLAHVSGVLSILEVTPHDESDMDPAHFFIVDAVDKIS